MGEAEDDIWQAREQIENQGPIGPGQLEELRGMLGDIEDDLKAQRKADKSNGKGNGKGNGGN